MLNVVKVTSTYLKQNIRYLKYYNYKSLQGMWFILNIIINMRTTLEKSKAGRLVNNYNQGLKACGNEIA